MFDFKFNLTVINNESLHLIEGDFDLIISDEHHRNGAFPKPNKVTKLIRDRYKKKPFIFLSGTPTPETYSQIFHQFWVSDRSPFSKYVNFYQWAKVFVNVTERHLGYAVVKDYSGANTELIKQVGLKSEILIIRMRISMGLCRMIRDLRYLLSLKIIVLL